MHVTFRAIVGPMVGKEFVLHSAQLLQVGRTDWADVAFCNDGHMSSIHFAVETDHATCYVKDLDSTNGTFLNGRRIKRRQVVENGDEVVAGDTSFKVTIEGQDLEIPEGAAMRKTATQSVAKPSSNSSGAQRAGLARCGRSGSSAERAPRTPRPGARAADGWLSGSSTAPTAKTPQQVQPPRSEPHRA